jgi:hypothetical protein
MIEDKTAAWLVTCGWVAALLMGFSELLRAFLMSSRLDHLAVVDAVIFFGLAFGIARRGRVVTLIALGWWLVECYPFLRVQVGWHTLTLLVLFTVAFLFAVVGAFALAANNRERELMSRV